MLKATSKLSLASKPEVEQDSIQLIRGDQKNVVVLGRTLEAQFINASGELLLILTDNCPFEETVRLVLLDSELTPIDSLEYASPYESLLIEEVVAKEDSQVLIKGSGKQLFVNLLDHPMKLLMKLAAQAADQQISENGRIVLTP